MDYQKIAERVRAQRAAKGMSREQLALLSGCHWQTVGNVERAHGEATVGALEAIASGLGVTLAWLLGGDVGRLTTAPAPKRRQARKAG